jgi:hypothetical protein
MFKHDFPQCTELGLLGEVRDLLLELGDRIGKGDLEPFVGAAGEEGFDLLHIT